MFLLIKWLPIETPFGLILGLALTSGVCICERIVTSRLEKVSMRLYQHQQQQQQQQELVWRQRRQRKHRSQVRSKARSSASATTVRTNSAEPDLISSEFEPQTAASGSRDSHRRPSLPPFPRPKVGDDDGEEGSSGNKISGKGLLVQKMTYYAIANMLRLSYMLLAMSFHIGVLTVIVASLTCMQGCLDHAALQRSEGKTRLAGYERLGSPGADEMENDLDRDRNSGEGFILYDLDEDRLSDEEEDEEANSKPMRSNVALTISHDCV